MCNNTYNNAQHISRQDIERRLSLLDDIISDDNLSFVERFDEHVDSCDNCSERFDSYIMISSLLDEPQDFPISISDLIKNFINDLLDKGGILVKALDVAIKPTPNLVFAGTRSIGSEILASNTKSIDINIDLKNEDHFFFELSKESRVSFNITIPQESIDNYEYEVYLLDGSSFKNLPCVKLEIKKQGDSYVLKGDTPKNDPLKADTKYAGIIMRIKKDE